MTVHDAQKVLSDLRDHLARHDKPIAFLFGAGTSCAVAVPGPGASLPIIPAVLGLTTACKADVETLGAKYSAAWGLIEDQCRGAKAEPHVENILSRLRMMLQAVGSNDTLCTLTRVELTKLEECVRKTIARVVTPDLATIPNDFPHRKLAKWIGRTTRKSCIELFTVNYDVLLEHALESERVPLFDGFVGSFNPFFLPDSLRRPEMAPGPNWARLWKMHGSVTWRRLEQEGRLRIVRGAPDGSGEMILPSFQKYEESRQQPYSAFTDRLSRFLEQDDALLIVAGFNFGDDHINDLVFAALENRPRTHVYALQFDEPPDASVLVHRALKRTNLIVLGPRTGIISGQRAPWSTADTPAFMKGFFEVKEVSAAENNGVAGEKHGHMHIGDFACLCRFLESMAS